ncbi:MAG: hypothetical protein IT450_19700 [Phycisphaerales bacterium]|nr:hypothetical protein [Phycisphaerales bacterium]
MRLHRLSLVSIVLAASLAAGGLAQSPPDEGERPRRPGQVRPGDRPVGPGRAMNPEPGPKGDEDVGLAFLRGPGPNPFRPRREDFGPVGPEEERALLEFVQQRQPRLWRGLTRLKADDPERFKERFSDVAPRLRVLRRLFETRRQVAVDFVQHMENMEELFRAMRAWRGADARRRQLIETDVQRLIGENLQIELRLIDDRITDLTTNHDRYSREEAERLAESEGEPPPEPARLAQFIRAVRTAQTDAQRQTALADLQDLLWLLIDDQIEDLRGRVQVINEDPDATLRFRLEGFRKRAALAPLDDGVRKPGRDPDRRPPPPGKQDPPLRRGHP